MPHVVVKLWPGKSEDQKTRLAEQIARLGHLGGEHPSRSDSNGALSQLEYTCKGPLIGPSAAVSVPAGL